MYWRRSCNIFDGIMNVSEWVFQIFASSYKFIFSREFNQFVRWKFMWQLVVQHLSYWLFALQNADLKKVSCFKQGEKKILLLSGKVTWRMLWDTKNIFFMKYLPTAPHIASQLFHPSRFQQSAIFGVETLTTSKP